MREELLKEVLLELQEQQRRNEEADRRRREEVRNGHPELEALTQRRERLIQDGMKAILRGEMTADDLPERMASVSGEIQAQLAREGLPADYLSPVYSCPQCRDTGYVGDRIRELCPCVRQRYQARLRRSIGLPEDGSETFERFDPMVFPDIRRPGESLSQRELMVRVRNACEGWADAYPEQSHRNLILSGKSGLGKTFLLHAIANRLIERGHNVLLLSAYSFLEISRRSYFENDGRLEELIATEILLLDDLGSEPLMQNVTVEQLFQLINERQRRNLTTVLSTNLNQEEIRQRYTERIASRLTDRRSCLFISLVGQDIRNGRG